ncbi:MAG TPA: hypothetical protein VM243_12495 [Phycisphaerae bacterium]|nr:hypothetical protein [Phycisphaerae bacterium]
MAAPITIEQSPWYEREAPSPQIGDDQFALEVAFSAARRDDKPTVALLGAYRLPGRYGDMYGGRIPGAINIVGIDPATGRLWFNTGETVDAAPLKHAMDPDPEPPKPGAVQRVAVEGLFNADFAGHLGLPPEKAGYSAFAWLDEMTSSVHSVDVPENKDRPETRGHPPGWVDVETLRFQRSAHSPKLEGSPIALRWRKTDPSAAGVAGIDVYGALDPKLLPQKPPQEGEPPTYVTVMALGHRNRELQWCSAGVPAEAIEAKEGFFEFSLRQLVEWTEPAQRVFVLCVVGTEKSDVLVIDPARQARQ